MNAMENAFASAGVPVKSLRERLWQIIKDRGPTTRRRLVDITGEDDTRVANALSQMATYGFLTCKRASGIGAPGVYIANGATYEEAVTLQRKPIRVTEIRPGVTSAPAAPARLATTFKTPTMLCSIPKELEDYTIAQLRSLRDVLNALFPGG